MPTPYSHKNVHFILLSYTQEICTRVSHVLDTMPDRPMVQLVIPVNRAGLLIMGHGTQVTSISETKKNAIWSKVMRWSDEKSKDHASGDIDLKSYIYLGKHSRARPSSDISQPPHALTGSIRFWCPPDKALRLSYNHVFNAMVFQSNLVRPRNLHYTYHSRAQERNVPNILLENEETNSFIDEISRHIINNSSATAPYQADTFFLGANKLSYDVLCVKSPIYLKLILRILFLSGLHYESISVSSCRSYFGRDYRRGTGPPIAPEPVRFIDVTNLREVCLGYINNFQTEISRLQSQLPSLGGPLLPHVYNARLEQSKSYESEIAILLDNIAAFNELLRVFDTVD